ncbi:MAG TPA: hypothetical protein DEP92_00890 [Candidatus Komeilibacteria bacterium]|nr:hypothetical protein [Candidatus Komeilibacteria bacterium]
MLDSSVMSVTAGLTKLKLWLRYSGLESIISGLFCLGVLGLVVLIVTLISVPTGLPGWFCYLTACLTTALTPWVRYGPLFDLFNQVTPEWLDRIWKRALALLYPRFSSATPVKLRQLLTDIKTTLDEIKELLPPGSAK